MAVVGLRTRTAVDQEAGGVAWFDGHLGDPLGWQLVVEGDGLHRRHPTGGRPAR